MVAVAGNHRDSSSADLGLQKQALLGGAAPRSSAFMAHDELTGAGEPGTVQGRPAPRDRNRDRTSRVPPDRRAPLVVTSHRAVALVFGIYLIRVN